jgi:hypothetical protein
MEADVSSTAGAKAAASGAAVVYHAAQPHYTRWNEEFPAMTGAITEGAASADASKYERTFGPFDPTPHEAAKNTPPPGYAIVRVRRRFAERLPTLRAVR